VLDAVVREIHTLSATVTTHPVEGGAKISDHMAAQPIKLELECLVTDTPLDKPKSHADGVELIGIDIPYKVKGPISIRLGPIGEIDPFAHDATAVVRGFSVDFNRVQAAWQAIRDLVGTKVVTVVTSLGDYADMAIENVSAPREDAVTKTLKFTAVFTQIKTVSSKTTPAPIPAIKAAVLKRRIGKAPPQPVDPTEESMIEDVSESALGSLLPN